MRYFRTFVAALAVLSIATFANADPATASRLGWVTNGHVQAAVQVGNTLYVGGTFTRVAPTSGALGSFFGASTTTGEPEPGFPLVDGVVHAIEPDGAGGYYIGGAFTSVGGVPRSNVAHVLADGSVDLAFAPSIDPVLTFSVSNGAVMSIALGTSKLFIGGRFVTVNGERRDSMAALNPTTGATVAWPNLSPIAPARRVLLSGANVVLVTAQGSSPAQARAFDQTTGAAVWTTTIPAGVVSDAIVVGSRLIVGGRLLPGMLLSLDVATGVVDNSWNPSGTPPVGSPDAVYALAASGTTLSVGGSFSAFGGQPRANAAAVDIPTGTVTTWAPNPSGAVSALAVSPGGTIFLGGRFAQVGGDPRETFAEVDATGSVTAWIGNAYASTVQTLRVDTGGTLVIGAQTGVTGGSMRTNLAAFDLSSDTLLPWAPSSDDDVIALAAAGGSVFIGVSELVSSPSPVRRRAVFAVDGVTGGALPWTPPASTSGVTLLGTHFSRVYVSGSFQTGPGLLRLDSTTGTVDPGWRPRVGAVTHMVVSGDTIYVGGENSVAALDVWSGAKSPWNPVLDPFRSAQITGLAIDGGTVHIAMGISGGGVSFHTVIAVDAVSGLRTSGSPSSGGAGRVGALAVADGQLIVARDFSSLTQSSPPRGAGVAAFRTDGQAALWSPHYNLIDIGASADRSAGLLVTPTDVIVLGYNAAGPVPVQGIAVLPRTPSLAPTALRATAIDNLVILNWTGASAPTPYVIEAGSESGASNVLNHTTEHPLPSITGIAGDGTYYIRVRSANPPAGPASLPANEVALVVGCSGPTAPPTGLRASVYPAGLVELTWTPPPFTVPNSYVLEAGLSSGTTDITASVNGSVTGFGTFAPPGTYFARVRTTNGCGTSAPSSEIFFTVGLPDFVPPAPTGLTAIVVGSTVTIQWTPSPDVLGYRLEVGSQPGLADLATLPLTASSFAVSGVPNGYYYARVRAANATGLGPASSEFVIVVPQ